MSLQMKSINNSLLFLAVILGSYGHAQLDSYSYKRPLEGVSEQWHKVALPNSIFNKLQGDLSDLRIYGIRANDTLEAPYVLRVLSGGESKKEVNFKLTNTSSNSNGYYFTYEVPKKEIINKIQLHFEDEDFDWRIVLEGSQNQNEWFTILDDYRIVSIKNLQTNYKFTTLAFPDSEYTYYRLMVKSDSKPKMTSATLSLNKREAASYRDYPAKNVEFEESKGKTTIIEIELEQLVPVSYLKLEVLDKTDYYRPLIIQSVTDSVETEKGWKYSYVNMASGTLNSVEETEFQFNSILAKKMRIVIRNNDNNPLNFGNVEVRGYTHQLIGRFDQAADYYLAYGKSYDRSPTYDIAMNGAKIPTVLPTINLGKELSIPKSKTQAVSPLFENKIWLWVVMGMVILILGGFTLKMMQNKEV